MKIVHLITSFALGGAERVACDLAAGQVQKGHKVFVVAMRKTPKGQDVFAKELLVSLQHAGVISVDLGGWNFRDAIPLLIFKLWRFVKQEKPDILHLHADPAEFIGSITALLCPVHVVRTIHNTVIWPTHPIMGWIAEHALKKDSVAAVSQDALTVYEQTRYRFGVRPSEKRTVILNGVPIPDMNEREKNAVFSFAFFGRNAPQKGIDVLSKACERLDNCLQRPMRLDVYSDIDKVDFYRPKNHKLSLSIRPPHPKAREIMAHYDCILVPSRFEGFGLVAVEAMAAGVPPIVTNAPGLREVMPKAWPLTVPIESPESLADKMMDMANGKFDLEKLSTRARAQAEIFNLDKQVERYMYIYKACVAGQPLENQLENCP